MRTKGLKWAFGALSIATIAMAIFFITTDSRAQDDMESDEVNIEQVEDVSDAAANVDMKCGKECEGTCTEEEMEECMSNCGATCSDKEGKYLNLDKDDGC